MSAPEPNPAPDPAPTPPIGPPRSPALLRSRHDRVIGGVCGGLGRYLGIDPVLMRIAFVVLAVAGGSGLLAYLLAWVLIPEEPSSAGSAPPAPAASGVGGQVVVGALLVSAGVVLLLDQVVPGFRSLLGPLVLIALGATVLVVAMRR